MVRFGNIGGIVDNHHCYSDIGGIVDHHFLSLGER